jgi:predicted small secreted protein
MKKIIRLSVVVFCTSMLLTSCYTYTSVVGRGAQGNTQVKKWNHYLINGLVPVGVSDSKEMAGGATDYSVKTEMSFVNGLVSGLTFGIYAPSTTTVTK